MKNFTLYFLVLITCGIQELNAQTCVSSNKSHSLDRYLDQKFFKPKPTDSVKTIRVNFNVIQYKIGDERNFINIPIYTDFMIRVIETLNNGFSLLKIPAFPQTCVCGSDCYIEDTRIRFELQSIKFVLDSVWYQDSIPSRQLSLHPNNNLSVYNIYITSGNFGGGSNGNSYSILDEANGFVGRGYYQAYLADSAVDTNTKTDNLHYAAKRIAGHLQHEIGHSFDLSHLYTGPCCPDTYDTSNVDYLWDFWGKGTVSCPRRNMGTGDFCNQDPASDTCVSNWMGNNPTDPLHRELTPLQLGRVHRSTMLSSMRKYFKPSADHVADHNITTNETWDFNIRMYGDIVVKSGATLTIRCKVLMPPKGEIRVEPNGKLIVDGGTITSTEDGPTNMWKGIEVEGSNSYSQYQTYSFGLAHGIVEVKNNALIENAEEAIVTNDYYNNYGGSGVIKAYNSTFRNNAYGVRLGSYQDLGAHKNNANQSEFVGCTFEWDSTFFLSTAFVKSGIELIGVKKVKIDSCTFIHLYPPSQSFKPRIGIGIMTSDASPIIKKCLFENMENGIKAQSLQGSLPVIAQYNTFKNNWVGTHVNKVEYATIQQNTYNTATQTGVIMAETKAFKVSENGFYNGRTGIENRNLGSHSNEIYNNTFTGEYMGIANNGFTNQSNKGLSFKCNYFASNLITNSDIKVLVGEVDKVQGWCDNASNNKFSLPSGNEFSHTCNLNTDGDFYALFHNNKIDYNHHFQVGSTGPYRPSCYSTAIVTPQNCITFYSNTLSCPDSSFKQTTSGSQLLVKVSSVRDHYQYQKHEFEVAEYDIAQLIDGGNTAARIDYIDPVSGYTSDDIKTEMISYSPYLSEEVLNACINRSPSLVDNDLFQILVANSPLSIELADALEGMTAVLTAPQIDNLVAIQGGISKRDSVQNDVRWNKQQTELALNELLRLFALDSNPDNPTDSMIYYLEDWDTPESKELLLPLYWEKEDFTKAQDAIDDIADEEENEHLDYVLQKMHDLLHNGDSIPVLLGDTLVLDSIALDSTKAGQAWAQNLMFRLIGKHYPTYLPDTSEPSAFMAEPEITPLTVQEELKNENIQVFPNPNKGKFVIEFKDISAKRLVVYTLEGKMIYEQNTNIESPLEVNLPKSLSGMLQLIVYGENEEIIHADKIIVNE